MLDRLKRIFQQRPMKLSKRALLLGGSQEIYSRLLFYYGAVNSLLVLSIFYNTVVKPTPWLSWLTPGLLIVASVPVLVIAGLVIWKWVIPYHQVYANWKGFKHYNWSVPVLERIERKLDALQRTKEGEVGSWECLENRGQRGTQMISFVLGFVTALGLLYSGAVWIGHWVRKENEKMEEEIREKRGKGG